MNAKKTSLTANEREMAQAASELAETGIPASEQPGVGPKRVPSRLLLILAAMGPGIITAMAGNDAGGISTYSTAGANFGFGTLWVIPIMCVLLIVVETTAGRMGAVTGKGFAALIRERFGIRLAAFAMLALLVGNVATTFSEFAGIASGMEMFGVSKYISVPVAALAVWLLVVGGSYKRVHHLYRSGVSGPAELGRGGPRHRGAHGGGRCGIHLARHRHDRHHHRPLDDVLHPEQCGGEGPHDQGSVLAAGGCRLGHYRRLHRGLVHHRDHRRGALPRGHLHRLGCRRRCGC